MTVSDGQPQVNATESSALSLDDGDLYVCQDGPRDAPALLLIHGSASSTRSWDPLVPLLTGAHRVIRIDLLGYGRSAKPADRSYEIPDQGRRVGVALDRLGVRHAIVVGHSSGGVVATALASMTCAR
jgi:pimeloyl-ACP methyl ester carboxylesterase